MSQISALVTEFIELLRQGRQLEAVSRFYDDEVLIFENRTLARAGRSACLAFEEQQLRELKQGVHFKLCSFACNERTGHAFIEYVLRFTGSDGRPLRAEEVAVQTWSRGKIVQQRFYYEGLIDEGTEEGEFDVDPPGSSC